MRYQQLVLVAASMLAFGACALDEEAGYEADLVEEDDTAPEGPVSSDIPESVPSDSNRSAGQADFVGAGEEVLVVASVSNCTKWYPSGTSFSASCKVTSGSGYRARVRCYYIDSDGYVLRYGPWRYTSNQTSTAYCSTGTEAASGDVQYTAN